MSADAAAFHSEFVTLLNGGAGAYVGAEFANAERAGSFTLSGSAAASTPILGGARRQRRSGGGILGGLLGPLSGGSGGGILGGRSAR